MSSISIRMQIILLVALALVVGYIVRIAFGSAWGWRVGVTTLVVPTVLACIAIGGNYFLRKYDHQFKSH